MIIISLRAYILCYFTVYKTLGYIVSHLIIKMSYVVGQVIVSYSHLIDKNISSYLDLGLLNTIAHSELIISLINLFTYDPKTCQ